MQVITKFAFIVFLFGENFEDCITLSTILLGPVV